MAEALQSVRSGSTSRSIFRAQQQRNQYTSTVLAEHCSRIVRIASTALNLLARHAGRQAPSEIGTTTTTTAAVNGTASSPTSPTSLPRPSPSAARIPFEIMAEVDSHIHSIAESIILLVYLRKTASFEHNAEHWRRWKHALKKFVALCYQESKLVRREELTVEDVLKWVPPASPREVGRALRSVRGEGESDDRQDGHQGHPEQGGQGMEESAHSSNLGGIGVAHGSAPVDTLPSGSTPLVAAPQ